MTSLLINDSRAIRVADVFIPCMSVDDKVLPEEASYDRSSFHSARHSKELKETDETRTRLIDNGGGVECCQPSAGRAI